MEMIKSRKMATGTVSGLAINGDAKSSIKMGIYGPEGDIHATEIYDPTVPALKPARLGRHGEHKDVRWTNGPVTSTVNHRKWTAVSTIEQRVLAEALKVEGSLPSGGELDNITIDSIEDFSAIPPGYELAFLRDSKVQCRLLVREPNTPCLNAAKALWHKVYSEENPDPDFVQEFKAQELIRGLMGTVILPGDIYLNDEVKVFSSKLHPNWLNWR